MPGYRNTIGENHEVELNVGMYADAAALGMSLPQYINSQHPTNIDRDGTAFDQMLASEGIFVRNVPEIGIRASTMADIVNGPKIQGATVVKDGIPASRILFPAVAMQAIEDKLVANLTMTANAFDALIGYDESIVGYRYEQPKLNFSRPEAARSQGVAQLAQPASMLTITASDNAYKIPSFALGMEIADQALQTTTLDFVARSLARQAAVERNERAHNYILALLNGDIDNGDGSLASLGLSMTQTSLDSGATGGLLSQKAWMKFLMKDGTKRTITHMITDIDTAMKIEARTGKPTINDNDGTTNRFDTQFTVMNPTWATNPGLFILDNAAWPASTIMAMDKAWAIRRVRSLTADFQGIEAYILRRSTAMRFDFGEHVNRMYNEAFTVLTLV